MWEERAGRWEGGGGGTGGRQRGEQREVWEGGREYEGGDRRGEFENRGQTRSYEHKHRYPWNLQNYVFWEMTKKVNNVKVRQTASPTHPRE